MTTQCKTIAARTAQFCDMWISAARARSELSVAPKICRSHQPMGKSHVSRLTLRPKLETALNLIAFERRMSQVRHCHRNDGHRRRCHARLPRTWYTRCRYRRSARLGSVHGRLRDDGHPGCGIFNQITNCETRFIPHAAAAAVVSVLLLFARFTPPRAANEDPLLERTGP
jgi:hypothetical protein